MPPASPAVRRLGGGTQNTSSPLTLPWWADATTQIGPALSEATESSRYVGDLRYRDRLRRTRRRPSRRGIERRRSRRNYRATQLGQGPTERFANSRVKGRRWCRDCGQTPQSADIRALGKAIRHSGSFPSHRIMLHTRPLYTSVFSGRNPIKCTTTSVRAKTNRGKL